ncbi:Pentatricopeptide repeat-containing protein, mitochondrial [Ananas comosus]|uniref:Pentatricopeptide repeat-containing protein, mitochondrial n=1 Tax=Ananas comosus TaxID=4615 RepID=A0A199W0F3_ANACO|nr:Pentatricopeptide repeat-containing protein, mitochondrial [Ananas comosus]
MYLQFHDRRSAAAVFLAALRSGSLSWSYLIDFFGGDPHQLLSIFRELRRLPVEFSVGVLVAVLQICAECCDLLLGFQIHGSLIKQGLDSETYIKCSVMDFYADCWSLESVDMLFEEIPVKDPILWNKLVMLNVEKGMCLRALELFCEMRHLGVEADEVAMAKVLHACGKLEALREGKAIHGFIVKSRLLSALLYGCVGNQA